MFVSPFCFVRGVVSLLVLPYYSCLFLPLFNPSDMASFRYAVKPVLPFIIADVLFANDQAQRSERCCLLCRWYRKRRPNSCRRYRRCYQGMQVIPDRLNSPPLVEIEIGSPGVVEIGLEEGEKPLYEQDERKSRSSTFVARRLGEPGPPAGRLVPGREGRNLPSSRTLPASRTLPSRGTLPSRTRPPSRTLPSRDRHPLPQEEEEEELRQTKSKRNIEHIFFKAAIR
ncbi:hypothetical protein C8J56DRAFT_270817 [Mycena floridula]|nr:hypothetical protein C8J56DRAFT_270817 [Mycena floridula]